ncbi:MAG: Holliday junction branch migration protein RuvA [Candidatus Pacebacteria bacterium]|nr:Holliday junction branch migration protein RuvA [Candidatus Paceibacterota bacterium]PIR60679.1 MAG: Holliday junction branch migration protein RuvA [Candidatus Pacebacteria bacterium CG10_big_fil_rev_8_21_14_0_10_44_54]
MIAFLTGTLHQVGTPLILLVGGVGYSVRVAEKHQSLWSVGQNLSLWIHTHVAETKFELFGFPDQKEKELFLLLLQVSGVGPSTALQLGAIGSEKISQAVRDGAVRTFTQVPRVGKKLAQKIIIELGSKLGAIEELQLGTLDTDRALLLEALLSLGYEEQRVYDVVRKTNMDNQTLEQALKQTMQTIGTTKT